MKIIDNILYIEFADAIESGISSNTLKKASERSSPSWKMIPDPTDKRKVLIEYAALKQSYKDQIEKRYGNPFESMAKEPIRKMVAKDNKSEEFFLAYRFDGNKMLPIEHVNKYVTAASWLNMLLKAEANKKDIKKQLNLSLADFWLKVCEIIKSDGIDLPSTYQRLRQKITDYQTNSYSSLIHKQFGNNNATKVCSEVAESLLIQMLSRPHFDDTIVCRQYNTWAVSNDHEPISSATVSNWKRKNMHLIMGEKKGNKEWYNVFGKQIMRNRPSAPLLLIGGDDNDLDLYFNEDRANKKGYTVVNHYFRYKLIVVMDAFNDYILGYSFGDTVTADLVRLAYLDAMHHTKELTGDWYLPHQLQTDRWGKGTLNDFYTAIGTYTPATARAARGKYIEQAFGVKWHQTLAFYPNYSGHNITAKEKTNADFIELHKKGFPTKEHGPHQIEDFINQMRNLVNDKTGVTRQQEWVTAFQQSAISQSRKISREKMLLTFGTRHDYKNQISNKGITPSINCIERTYEIPDEHYLHNVGKRVQVIFDPFDFSSILVTDNDKVRFIATEYDKMPSAIADYKPGDRTRLNSRIEEKKRHVEHISNQRDNRNNVLFKNRIDAEGLLQAGVLVKELKQNAELTYQQSNNKPEDFDPFDQM